MKTNTFAMLKKLCFHILTNCNNLETGKIFPTLEIFSFSAALTNCYFLLFYLVLSGFTVYILCLNFIFQALDKYVMSKRL